MSLIDDAQAPYALISSPIRAISLLVPHVTVEEIHQDALGITGYPVETGATKTDHSFRLPARVEMTVGWSNSTAGTVGYVQQIYAALLRIQATREPFDLYTGKRVYRSMLMEGINLPTTAEWEHAMLPRLAFRELQISRTRSTSTGALAPNSAHKMPEVTGAVEDRGRVEPQLVDFSGNNGTAFGGYDPSLGLGPRDPGTGFATIDFDGVTHPGLPGVPAGAAPSGFDGNIGLFGRYNPNSFLNPRPFRI